MYHRSLSNKTDFEKKVSLGKSVFWRLPFCILVPTKQNREVSIMNERKDPCTTSTRPQTLAGGLYLAAFALVLVQALIGA